jgi:hypothetical protein
MWLRKVHYRNVKAEEDFTDTRKECPESVSEAEIGLWAPFIIPKVLLKQCAAQYWPYGQRSLIARQKEGQESIMLSPGLFSGIPEEYKVKYINLPS